MASQGESFIARQDVKQALDELFGECFATIEANGEIDRLPDVREFLQDRGIEAPPELKLELGHSVDDTVDLDAGVQPLGPICDEKGTRAYTQCEQIKGKIHCHWVCP